MLVIFLLLCTSWFKCFLTACLKYICHLYRTKEWRKESQTSIEIIRNCQLQKIQEPIQYNSRYTFTKYYSPNTIVWASQNRNHIQFWMLPKAQTEMIYHRINVVGDLRKSLNTLRSISISNWGYRYKTKEVRRKLATANAVRRCYVGTEIKQRGSV